MRQTKKSQPKRFEVKLAGLIMHKLGIQLTQQKQAQAAQQQAAQQKAARPNYPDAAS
jgi:hypothetical protein